MSILLALVTVENLANSFYLLTADEAKSRRRGVGLDIAIHLTAYMYIFCDVHIRTDLNLNIMQQYFGNDF